MRKPISLLACVALGAGVLASGAPRADAPAGIRVFAIGYKHLIDDAESYASYRARLLRLADRADPAPETDADPRPKLFVFPEDSALYAMFIGARGRGARGLEPLLRRAGGSGATLAVASLFAAYQGEAAYYRAVFPDQNSSETRLGLLALTDTLYRSFFETFREIAVRHHAWVEATANVAPAAVTTDPALVALLGDPEALGRPCGDVAWPCAYRAVSPNVYNQAFVFRPDGSLVANPYGAAAEGPLDGAVKKTYLTPIEQGPVEQGKAGLDLAYGDLRQARPIQIAGIPMGIVISKPAWMLDELGRLEAYGARIMLQPEAFSSWGAPVEDWSPDVLKESGWQHTQKYAPFRYSVLSELTGNFFDLVFDAQNHVAAKATVKALGPARYIGQPDDVGWVAVSPWVVGDGPGEECGRAALRARRECLALVGAALGPGSGDLRENAYEEPLAAAVLDPAPPPPDAARAPGIFGSNVRVDDAPAGARAASPAVAARANGQRLVVWQDDRDGVGQIRIARVTGGAQVSASRAVAPTPGVRQIAPQVAVTPDGALHVVWGELDPAPRVMHAVAPGWDAGFGPPQPIGESLAADEGWAPAVAVGGDGAAHVAWIALTRGFERLAYTRISPDGTEGSRLLDAEAFPAPDPLAERLNNRWNPAVAVRENVVAIAWTDFRNYSWDVFATISRDGGETFSAHRRVDDATRMGGAAAGLERLHNDPAIVISEGGVALVAWTDQAGRRAGCGACPQQRRPDADVALATAELDSEFSPNVRIDDTGDGLASEDRTGFSNQWRPSIAEDPTNGRLVAVWQDHREGNNDVFLAFSDDGGRTWSANARVDDTGSGHSNQYAPAVASDRKGVLTIAWQDDRDGLDHVYMALGSPSIRAPDAR